MAELVHKGRGFTCGERNALLWILLTILEGKTGGVLTCVQISCEDAGSHKQQVAIRVTETFKQSLRLHVFLPDQLDDGVQIGQATEEGLPDHVVNDPQSFGGSRGLILAEHRQHKVEAFAVVDPYDEVNGVNAARGEERQDIPRQEVAIHDMVAGGEGFGKIDRTEVLQELLDT